MNVIGDIYVDDNDKRGISPKVKMPKNVSLFTSKNSPLAEKSEVKRIIENINANVNAAGSNLKDQMQPSYEDINTRIDLNATRKGSCIDAFELLMVKKRGDTPQKPSVRKRLKRLEKDKFTTPEKASMDIKNWARKWP